MCGFPAFRGNDEGVWCYPPSRTSGLRSVPMPVISTSQTSPCFMSAVAPSVPIHTTSPGYRVRYCVMRLRKSATPNTISLVWKSSVTCR